jgi:hypothetical protein
VAAALVRAVAVRALAGRAAVAPAALEVPEADLAVPEMRAICGVLRGRVAALASVEVAAAQEQAPAVALAEEAVSAAVVPAPEVSAAVLEVLGLAVAPEAAEVSAEALVAGRVEQAVGPAPKAQHRGNG